MSTTLPVGVTMRPLDVTSEADLDAAFAVASACELEAVGWTDETPESVRSTICGPQGLAEGHRLVFEATRPVGLLEVEFDRHGREFFLDAYSLGTARSTIARALLEDGLRTAVGIATADPVPSGTGVPEDPYELSPDIWQVVGGTFAQDHEYVRVLQSLGFRPIRRFWRMLCDLADAPDAEPDPPAGVTKRVVSGESDRRLLHELFETSFAEHFGSTHDEPFEEWIARVEASPGNDPSRWWIAELDGRPVGLCILDDSKAEFGEGYVRTLGVLKEARGRGIGRWLLQCGAVDAVQRGRSSIALTVDGANTTGATALYESVGYAIRQEIDVYCYPLVDSPPSR
jgi:ribosomal protein S18 acetylase RimI-like enzyme